jgi:hypothetical protein
MKTYKFLDVEQTRVAVFDEDGLNRVQTVPAQIPDSAVIAPYVPPAQADIDAAQQLQLDNLNAQVMEADLALKAFALIVLDEINTLRAAAGLVARTPAQLKAAHRAKLGAIL